MISPIGDLNSPTRLRSDGFLLEVIRPVCEKLGYVVERADEDKSPGLVTESIVGKIIDADLVIADLHGLNPNVMYEVAIRHATDKPLIQMIERGETLPFDIGGLNTVFYDPSVIGLKQWREDLAASIDGIKAGKSGSNPVSRAGLFKTLQSQSPAQSDVVQVILDSIHQLRSEITAPRSPPSKLTFDAQSPRILVTKEQYVVEVIKNHVASIPWLAGRSFVFEVKDGKLVVSSWPSKSNGPGVQAVTRRYEIGEQDNLGPVMDKMKADVLRDFTGLEAKPEDDLLQPPTALK